MLRECNYDAARVMDGGSKGDREAGEGCGKEEYTRLACSRDARHGTRLRRWRRQRAPSFDLDPPPPCSCSRPPSSSSTPSPMSSVSRLQAVLSSAFSSRGLPNGEQEFFEELMAHRPQLANLYDVGPRNPQEQRELESGTCVIAHISVLYEPLCQGKSRSTVVLSR